MTEREAACATRKQLLDAALAVIGEKGYSAATVDEIVEAAGVSKGVAYYHFKSKAAMAESILEEGIGDLIEGFERIAAEAPTAPVALTGMVELFATRIFENKAFGRFFVSELWREGRVWSESMRSYEGRLLDVLESQLARGQREGVIRPEIDPAFEAVALIGMECDHHAVLSRRRGARCRGAPSRRAKALRDRRQGRLHRAASLFLSATPTPAREVLDQK